jgi:hypothetical protein
MEPVIKTNSTQTYKLDSVSWTKPGVIEVQISAYFLSTDAQTPAKPNVNEYVEFEGPAGPLTPSLQAVSVRNQGVANLAVWIFRAGKALPDSPTDKQEDDKGSKWTMDVSLMQIPIARHPNLKRIMEVGGGVFKDGEVDFPRMLNGAKNPYYGTSDFLLAGVTMTREIIRQAGEAVSYDEIDCLGYSNKNGVEQHPAGWREGDINTGFAFMSALNWPGSAKRRSWLLVEQNHRKVGAERVETKTWRYGGVMGWPDALYDDGFDYTNTAPSPGQSQSPMGA